MHIFGSLNTLVPGDSLLAALDLFSRIRKTSSVYHLTAICLKHMTIRKEGEYTFVATDDSKKQQKGGGGVAIKQLFLALHV